MILHLLRAVHAKYHNHKGNRPKVIYFENDLEFPGIRHFVENTVYDYDLQMLAFDTKYSFVDGLQLIVDDHEKEGSHLAFVLGTSKCFLWVTFVDFPSLLRCVQQKKF